VRSILQGEGELDQSLGLRLKKLLPEQFAVLDLADGEGGCAPDGSISGAQ